MKFRGAVVIPSTENEDEVSQIEIAGGVIHGWMDGWMYLQIPSAAYPESFE